jgi:hypothetical protein
VSRKSEDGPDKEGGGEGPGEPNFQARIDGLKEVPPDRDLVLDNLDALMGHVVEAALENFEVAKRCADPVVKGVVVEFGLKLTHGYAKLVSARDKHRKMTGG